MMPFVNSQRLSLLQRVVVPPVLIAALVAATFFCVSCSSRPRPLRPRWLARSQAHNFSAGPTAAHATTTR